MEHYYRLIVDGKRIHDDDYWSNIRRLADEYLHRCVVIETVRSEGDTVVAKLRLKSLTASPVYMDRLTNKGFPVHVLLTPRPPQGLWG